MLKWVVIVAFVGLCAVAWAAGPQGGVNDDYILSYATVIGALGGFALYHAAFGFTGGWRRIVRERRGQGFRAQLLLIAMTVLVSFPLLAYGDAIGVDANGWVFPVGVASAIGAAMFGFGMQLGGGCGSGTLFTVGGGSTRMVITLVAFIAGSVLWTGTAAWTQGLPRIEGVSALSTFGMPGALAIVLGALALIYWATLRIELSHHAALEPRRKTSSTMFGPWSLELGALALALVVVLTLLVLGRPWGITSAYPFWGVKALDALGAPVLEWNGWSQRAADRSIFSDGTSVMNIGIMLGALAASGLAGKFAPTLRLSFRDVWTAVLGGLLMGYGARLAYGCNIGGFVGGVISGSLHGWWWLIFGFAGSWLGVIARGAIGMDPPLSKKSA
ncbi:MAG: YeeE/YedE family protein [Pseudomonadota bacterium]